MHEPDSTEEDKNLLDRQTLGVIQVTLIKFTVLATDKGKTTLDQMKTLS